MVSLSHWKAKAVILLLLCLSLTGILLAYSAGPPLAYTGDFGQPNCTACHTGNPLNAAGGSLTIMGAPVDYTPGQTYPITVMLDKPGQLRWGFELSARVVTSGSQGGILVATDINGTQVRTAADIQYISHTSLGTSSGQAGPKSWTFNWTAPSPPVGPIRFSAVGNAANNNFSTTGDFIYTATATSNGQGQVEPPPALQITTDKTTYITGEAVTATEFRIKNLGSVPVKTEIKVFLIIPGIEPISALNIGSDGTFELPAGFNQNFGPLAMFTVTAEIPRGTYEFSSRLLNPVTGELQTEDLNTFVVQ